MNEKKFFLGFIIGLVIGVVGTAVIDDSLIIKRSAGKIASLTARNAELDRAYSERQRELESGLNQCLGYVEDARAITGRTGENASRAVSNLTEAIGLIRQGIAERKDLEVELDRLRAGLLGLRRLGGLDDE